MFLRMLMLIYLLMRNNKHGVLGFWGDTYLTGAAGWLLEANCRTASTPSCKRAECGLNSRLDLHYANGVDVQSQKRRGPSP